MRRDALPLITFLNPVSDSIHPWNTDLGLNGLRLICERLNLPQGDLEREELRALVAELQEFGIAALLLEKPELRKKLTTHMRVLWGQEEESGRACLFVLPDLPDESKGTRFASAKEAASNRAFASFWFLTLNTHRDKLAGPCTRCDRYFISKRATQRVYCSRRCGNACTAIARTRARLQAVHQDKLQRALSAIRVWNALQTRGQHNWVQWLREREPDITGKFITRHVNTGKLPEPKQS